ncbi:lactonase family protein [Kineosporia babensis]|uniref:Lactonase family protein n=1 Tax=Kineosporia babensis TaxID=499548 RepID=A0A9X1NJ47_9ACTN|nr:lactonase family protein [Kineosporia babensis]MCD5315977.1 lactonase family protein [Kineosporia babensis]
MPAPSTPDVPSTPPTRETDAGAHNVLKHEDLFFGTYTERLPHVDGQAPGIMRASYTGRGQLGETTLATVLRNPSWVTAFRGVLYAGSETHAEEGQGTVSAYRINTEQHTLTLLGMRPSGGADPAHLAISPDGRHLVVANYSGGSVALFGLQEETGRIGDQLDLVQHEGTGPNQERQTSPHPHMVAFAPDRAELFVPDLGIDAVLSYRIEDERLVPAGRIDCPAGSGPRHVAFHPSGDLLFVLGELNNQMGTYRRTDAGFVPVGSIGLLPESNPEGNLATDIGPDAGEDRTASTAAAVRVHSSGSLVFASNRGHDSISVFRHGPGNALSLIASVPVRGRSPRDIALAPDEQYLLSANQDSGSVTVFSVDAQAEGPGVLSYVGKHRVPTPVCLAWV